jgi:hypothetical protein
VTTASPSDSSTTGTIHAGQWWRSYGNELWEFDGSGLMRRREASINDLRIDESERRWLGPRPEDQRGPGNEIPLR